MRVVTVWCALVIATSLTVGAQPPGRLPAGAKSLPDLEYARPGGKPQLLDLFLPPEGKEPAPLIIWVHGGAWQAGIRKQCPALREVGRGYAVASLDYRFSQDAIFPAQIQDCKAAVRWLRAHATEYHLDPKHFAAWGSSAGGHLVALLGTAGDAKDLEGDANPGQSSRVQAVCDFYGPTDFTRMHDFPSRITHDAADSPESKLVGGAIQQNKHKVARANPITYVTPDDPPFLIVHGDQDPLVPPNQSELLVDALKKAKVEVAFHTVKGGGHGGPGFEAQEVHELVDAFFDRTLKPAKSPGVALLGQILDPGPRPESFLKISPDARFKRP